MAKGAEKYAGLGVAQQQGDFRRRQAPVAQMLLSQLPTCIGQQLLVAAILFGQASLQRAFAEVERPRQFGAVRLAMCQLLTEQADDPCAEAGTGQAGEQGFGMLAQQLLQRRVGLDQRQLAQRMRQEDGVVVAGELQRAGEHVLVGRSVGRLLMTKLRTQQVEVVQQRSGHLHPAGHHRQHSDARRRMLRMQGAIQHCQALVACFHMQLATLTAETLIAQRGIQRILQGGAALQQVAEHAEGTGGKIATEQQAGLRVLQARVQFMPEGFLSREGDARIGVGQLFVTQRAGAQQGSAIKAETRGSVQHRLGQAGADRGLRGFVRDVGHWPILPNAGNGR